jgi:hypothetical protein
MRLGAVPAVAASASGIEHELQLFLAASRTRPSGTPTRSVAKMISGTACACRKIGLRPQLYFLILAGPPARAAEIGLRPQLYFLILGGTWRARCLIPDPDP